MKTDSIRYTPNFNGLKFESNVSKELQTALRKSPAGKEFSRKYDAVVSSQVFMSSSDPQKTYLGFIFQKIQRNNIFSKIFDKIADISHGRTIQYNSKCQSEKELINQLPKLKKDRFTSIYEKY